MQYKHSKRTRIMILIMNTLTFWFEFPAVNKYLFPNNPVNLQQFYSLLAETYAFLRIVMRDLLSF